MRDHFSLQFNEAWRWSLQVWFLVRVVLSAVGLLLFVTHTIPENSSYGDLYFGVAPIRTGVPGAVLGVWQRWDAIHWERVARQGYADAGLSAFFPLYPALGRLFSLSIPAYGLLGLLIVSNTALLFSMVILYEITEQDYSKSHARLAVIVLTMFPAAFFLFAPYAESLLLMLILLAYRSIRRLQWWPAALAGTLAGFTHPLALALTVLLAAEAWTRRKDLNQYEKVKFSLAALSPCFGIGLFIIWRSLSGFPSYVASGENGWNLQWPWQAVFAIPNLFQTRLFFTSGWPNLIILSLVVISTLWELRRNHISASLFQAAVLLIILSTSHSTEPLGSLGRHCLIIFPMYIAITEWCKRPLARIVMLIVFMLSNLYLFAQFVQWRWVA